MGRRPNKLEGVWRHIDVRGKDECWPWTGVIKRYGTYTIKGEMFRAHRIVYFLTHPNEISLKLRGTFSADSDVVLHRCDNPICCNPSHLFLGKPKDNTQDMIKKGRQLDNRGTRCYRAMFSEAQIKDIRARYANGERVFEIASLYRCNWQTMDDIVKNKSYRNVCQ